MKAFHAHIADLAQTNTNFRQVIFTAPHSQLVLMSLLPNEEIGMEAHSVDQFFRFESGHGSVVVDGQTFVVKADDVVVVPAGAHHNVINTSSTQPLKLYTIYSPAQHPDGTIHTTKAEAEKNEKE
jgi:mannose-6-phosphate isomerase-like protein (cupin superfamily)